MFDEKQIKESLKAYMKGENLYDPLLDCKEEEWTNKHLSKKVLNSYNFFNFFFKKKTRNQPLF